MSKLVTKLKKYANLGYNVILTGKHGVGKTAIIKETFNSVYGEMGKDWLYFSASTLDPWIDFIGIPKNYTNDLGEEVFKIIPPENLNHSNIQALYFDEFNRSDEKVRNAVMELIQFKTINGRKFSNLKCVWASINPYDEDDMIYQVEELDPAQLDRFEIQINLKYDVDNKYFESKYGSEVGKEVCSWWRKLSDKEKENLSPRRLDYAIQAYNDNCDLKDLLSDSINISSLISILDIIETLTYLKKLFKENNKDILKKYLTINKINSLLSVFNSNKDIFIQSIPYIPKDFLFSLIDSKYNNIKKYILESLEKNQNDKIFNYLPNSIYLSLIYFGKIDRKTQFNYYPKFNESSLFIQKLISYDPIKEDFNSFLNCFSGDDFSNNYFCLNFLLSLSSLDSNLQNKLSKIFQHLNNNVFYTYINNNYNNTKKEIKNLFIFIFKISYMYLFVNENNKIYDFNIFATLAKQFINIIPIELKKDIIGFNSIHYKLFNNENNTLNHLPYILDLK